MKSRRESVTVRVVLGVLTLAQAAWLTPSVALAQQTSSASGTVLQLSMAQAEAMALESNLQLKVDRLDPALADENLAAARSVFNPTLGSSFSRGSSQRSSASVFEGSDSVTTRSLSFATSISQDLPWYGGSAQLRWNGSRVETTQAFATFNPSLSSGLQFNFTQPLLAGFKIDGQRQQVETATRNRSIADVQLDERIVITRVQAQLAYLSLVGATNQRIVAQQNLDLARQQLKDNQARVEVGTMAPIDIIEAEAEVASREEAVIRADAAIATAEDTLRSLILDPSRPDYWQVKIQATDTPSLQERTIDIQAAITTALAQRTDLQVARKQMEITDLSLQVTKNSTLPSLNLQLNYSASGSGGTENFYADGVFPPVIQGSRVRGFGAVFADSFRNNLPTWSLGFNLSYPIGKSASEATLARQRISRQQQETSLRALELQVVTSVRTVGRDLETNFKRVQVTQLARQRAERQLDSEQKKFAVGLSSTFQLQQRQRDLASARINELSATIDYNRSLIQFDAIQKAPVR